MHYLSRTPSPSLPLPYLPACVIRGALVAHRHSSPPPRCRTSQYRRTFVLSQCLCGTILMTQCLMVCDWRVLRAEPISSYWPNLLFLFVSYYFLFFFLPWESCVVLEVSDWCGVLTLSQPCTAYSFFWIILIINKCYDYIFKITIKMYNTSITTT